MPMAGEKQKRRIGPSIAFRLHFRLLMQFFLGCVLFDMALVALGLVYYRQVESAGLPLKELLFRQPLLELSVSSSGVFVPLNLVLLALLTMQVVLLLDILFRNGGVIRKALQPIEELAATAEKLNSVSNMSDEELGRLVGALDEIDAEGLDSRIQVSGTQRELQALAYSINNLFDRVGQAYDAQKRFVSDASHELRTPIAVIQGYADLLNRWGKDDPDTMQESIDAIRAESANMKEILEELLFLARGDNNSTKLEPQDVDMVAMAKEIVREYEMIDQSHVYLLDLPEKETILHIDPGLIKQSMRVLVDNAAKYSPEKRRILVSVQDNGREVRLSVEDEGQGISQQDLPHVFDRFYRTDESRARQTGGSGLGLSIAKWIVDRHSGFFEVVSRVGVGTRFTIVLPAKRKI